MMYDENYYKTGNYIDYMQSNKKKMYLTGADIIEAIEPKGMVLDFGCSVGHLVEYFSSQGYDARGVDISDWAVEQAKEKGLNVSKTLDISMEYDIVTALDVFEHMEIDDLSELLANLKTNTIVFRVPICLDGEDDYHLEVSRNDPTHIIRWTRDQWEFLFMFHGYSCTDLNMENIYCGPGGYSAISKKGLI